MLLVTVEEEQGNAVFFIVYFVVKVIFNQLHITECFSFKSGCSMRLQSRLACSVIVRIPA